MKKLFTSESVTEGHPDKVCDRISDAVLDEILKQDPMARVACETFCTTGVVTVMGEITSSAQVDIPSIVRKTVCEVGYDSEKAGFNGNTCAVNVCLDKQSPDIAMGVDNSYELKDGEVDELNQFGAGDQGLMFGYASSETEELMPLPISLAHKLAKQLTLVRKNGTLSYDANTLGDRFTKLYPELRDEYKSNIELYDEFLAEDFFINHGNAIVLRTINKQGETYWLEAEKFRRSLLGKRLPKEFYTQRDEIQQRWLQQAAQTAHDDFPAFSRACLEEEAAFYRKWSNCVLSSVPCGAGFRKRWTKKNQALFGE